MRAEMVWEAVIQQQRWGFYEWLLWAAQLPLVALLLLSWRWRWRWSRQTSSSTTSIMKAAAAAKKKQQEQKKKKKQLPPGPWPWPVVGNLPHVGAVPHVGMRRLNAAYGPLVYLRLGWSVGAIVTDEPSMVREILKKQDHVFASRPANIASEHFTYGGRDIAFAAYGAHWRSMRRLCLMELLTPRRLEEFSKGRREEVACMVADIASRASTAEEQEEGPPRVLVNLRDTFGGLSSNTLTRMVLGKRFFGPSGAGAAQAAEHKALIYAGFALINSFNVGDYVPMLRWLDLQSRERDVRRIMARVDALYDAIIDEYKEEEESYSSSSTNRSSFLHQLLSLRRSGGGGGGGSGGAESGGEVAAAEPLLDRSTLKAIMIDLVAAGTDTSSITSEWTMAELMRHPDVMTKVRDEIERVVGLDRLVEEKDLPALHYLKAVVKEIFRLHPVGAFLIPHVSLEDTYIAGYFVPKGTRALINTYSLGRNPKIWDRPDEFVPERFVGESVELNDPEFRIVPFGAGRRGCPGATLGTNMVLLGLARLIQCFEWTPVRPNEELKEAYGLMVLENPLEAYATPRLPSRFYH